MLDMWQQDANDARAYALRATAPDLPAQAGESFVASWNAGQLFSQSVASGNARSAVLNDIADDIFARTGDDPAQRWEGMIDRGRYGNDLDFLNSRIAARREQDPSFQYPDLTEEEIQRRMVAKSRGARDELAALGAREQTVGSRIGSIGGSVASGGVDPVNIVAFPIAAPTALGVMGTALAWGGIAGGTQAAIELLGAPYREQVQPGYGASSEPAANIIGGMVVGGAIGGTLKAAAAGWARWKGEAWPRTVRDAGNVIESEAHRGH